MWLEKKGQGYGLNCIIFEISRSPYGGGVVCLIPGETTRQGRGSGAKDKKGYSFLLFRARSNQGGWRLLGRVCVPYQFQNQKMFYSVETDFFHYRIPTKQG
jgi:hypothetical protein